MLSKTHAFKMSNKIYIQLICLFCLCFQLKSENISIIPISNLSDFPSNSTPRVFQDSDGFLWFGTIDGLCRYDAYQISVFRSNASNPKLLTNNEITCIEEDKNGKLWVGTRNGINIIDRETFEIIHLKDSVFMTQAVKCLRASSDGKMWVALENQVFQVNVDDFSKKFITNIPAGGVNWIYEDKQENIWICVWNNGLCKIDRQGEITTFPPVSPIINPFRILQDDKNQYWIATWGTGLYRFYPNSPSESMYVSQPILTEEGKPEMTVFGVIQDGKLGYIWVMTYSGIYAFSYLNNNEVKQVDVSYLFKNSNKIYSDFIKDRDGNLWVGAFSEGAFSINFEKPNVYNIDLSELQQKLNVRPNVTTIYEDDNGDIWLNQNRFGLFIYKRDKKQIKTFHDFIHLKDKYFLNISSIRKINNEMWLGLRETSAISIITKNGDDLIEKKRIDLSLLTGHYGGVQYIFEDSRHNVWIATHDDILVKPYNEADIRLFSSDFTNINSIIEDFNGNLWMTGSNRGIKKIEFKSPNDLSKYDVEEFLMESSGLLSNNINTASLDQNGDIWIGTQEGNLLKYEQKTKKFLDFSTTSGLTGEAVQNILVDNYNNIWISTNKRIFEFNPNSGAMRDYEASDGVLVNSFFAGSCFYNKEKNRLFFGGNRGITEFNPTSALVGSKKIPKVIISNVKVQNQSVIQNGDGLFKALKQQLTLNSNAKNIEIDFTTLDYTFSGKITYAYKMEGIDDDWVYTKRNFASFNQLKKGETLFHVKATDENGVWSNEISTLRIYKYPAFYETWWAYTLYVLLFLSAIYLILIIIRNRLRLKNELKIVQIEKEKSEELTQTKLRYFTNISHDFLTPLTIVSCLIDDIETIMKKKTPQFDMMRSNITRLRRLLQQVLDFRKVENGKMILKISENNISTFIGDICRNHFQPLIERKNIAFSFNSTPSNIPAFFDADKVDKIVFNILSNALKYTPDGGAIRVEIEKKRENDIDAVSIEISDTGIGIHPNDLKNIFTRFYSDRDNIGSDTNGIGLSLTKELVELHHGSISVKSELQKGTTFIIVLPIDKKSYAETELSSAKFYVTDENSVSADTGLEESDEEIKQEDINLLLVEDNEDLLYTVKNILQRRYRVLTATDGQIAINVLKNNDIDIVISDVMMPNMDGLELCRSIKGNIETSHIPVLLLTAKNSVEDRVECYNAGADGYISKPFNTKVLEARINNFLQNKKTNKNRFKENPEINISTLEYPSLDEEFLKKAIAIIEEHLSDSDFDIDTFSQEMQMSKSSLYRKIKTMTGLPPYEFIRNIRLKHACLLLKDKARTISEAAYAVGFTEPRYFSTCFKNEFNMTPTEYQKNQ